MSIPYEYPILSYKIFLLSSLQCVTIDKSETYTQDAVTALLIRMRRYDAISSIANLALRTLAIAGHRLAPRPVGNTDNILNNIHLTLTGIAHNVADRQRGHPQSPDVPNCLAHLRPNDMLYAFFHAY